ncbi:MAG: RnfABCDGE type electron transport complex subunit D [Herbinix sp.]|nr:RnfABCDGE type electron transport complex subunit D [Herbinix sp.]
MNTFPLIRIKWSNEHGMAALLLVLMLYHIPLWLDNPAGIFNALLLMAFTLVLDAIANLLKYKRLWCCVSAAVTAAIISLLTSVIPLWGQMVGLATALVFGKYIWGGTGKNKINPAMVGLLFILIFWKVPYPYFASSYWLLPAAVLGLLFLKIRPFAGIGFIIGALVVLLLKQNFNFGSILSNGVLFWSCIILTDPVTVTKNRWVGFLSGILAGFIALYLSHNAWIIVVMVFAVNLISFAAETSVTTYRGLKAKCKMPKVFSYEKDKYLDLTGVNIKAEEAEIGIEELSAEEIINSIKHLKVYGMGGAAFPTYKKIVSVRSGTEKKKYLIINGVECDPGLIHDEYILHNYPEEIGKAIEILGHCIDFNSIHLAVKSEEGLNFKKDILVHKVANLYPTGAEKILIKEVLNLTLRKEQIPAESGILVLNVQTVYSIYKAIYLNCPADTRFLTVANLRDKTAQVVKVRLGMKLQDIMTAVYPQELGFFAGGGLMQAHSAAEDAVLDPSINFIATGAFPKYKESPQCSQCGNCISNCPAGLMVNRIADLVDQGKLQDTLKYNPNECISCGSCSYFCLAGRNLAAKVKAAKKY